MAYWHLAGPISCVSLSSLGLQLSRVDGVTIYGPDPRRGRAALCSFNVEGVHPNDLSMIMDQEGALQKYFWTRIYDSGQASYQGRLWLQLGQADTGWLARAS